jgi:hypothetical protein
LLKPIRINLFGFQVVGIKEDRRRAVWAYTGDESRRPNEIYFHEDVDSSSREWGRWSTSNDPLQIYEFDSDFVHRTFNRLEHILILTMVNLDNFRAKQEINFIQLERGDIDCEEHGGKDGPL